MHRTVTVGLSCSAAYLALIAFVPATVWAALLGLVLLLAAWVGLCLRPLATNVTAGLGLLAVQYLVLPVLATVHTVAAINTHVMDRIAAVYDRASGDAEFREGIEVVRDRATDKYLTAIESAAKKHAPGAVAPKGEDSLKEKLRKQLQSADAKATAADPVRSGLLRTFVGERPTAHREWFSLGRVEKIVFVTFPPQNTSVIGGELIRQAHRSTDAPDLAKNAAVKDPKKFEKDFADEAAKQDQPYRELVDALEVLKERFKKETQVTLYSAIRFHQVVNGEIQWATFLAFWVGFLLGVSTLVQLPLGRGGFTPDPALARPLRLVAESGEPLDPAPGFAHHTPPPADAKTLTDWQLRNYLTDVTEPRRRRGEPISWLCETCLRALNAAVAGGTQESMREVVESACTDRRERTETGLELPSYVAWLIPAIGFVGTILGIGEGLLRAERMVNAPPERQGQEISGVTDMLGLAFDTTLVSLVLSMFVVLLIHVVRAVSDTLISRARRYCDENLIRRFRPG